MPLDRENGEFIPAFGPHDRPIPPNHKWRETPFYEAAQDDAIRAFMKKAKQSRTVLNPRINDDDWFAQTYASQGRIVFFFQKLIRSREKTHSPVVVKEFFHVVPISFPIDALRELALTGMWPFVPEIVQVVNARFDPRTFLPGGTEPRQRSILNAEGE